MPLAQYMQHALGNQHIVTSLVQKAAEANLSSATKARKQEQQKLLEVHFLSLQQLSCVDAWYCLVLVPIRSQVRRNEVAEACCGSVGTYAVHWMQI